jgi:hypothetical protein
MSHDLFNKSCAMRLILMSGFALLLSGCSSSVTQLSRLPETSQLAQPVPIDRPGPLLHEPTGFTFAERYDNFQRINAYRYDDVGQDVSFSYHDREPDCLTIATIYLYPTPRMIFIGVNPDTVASVKRDWLTSETERTERFINQHLAPKTPAEVDSVTTPVQGADLKGSLLVFRKPGKISEFRLFVLNPQWFLKYRFTYPESCQAPVNLKLEALIRQLPWTRAE